MPPVTEPSAKETSIDSPGVTRFARLVLLASVLAVGAVLVNSIGAQKILDQVIHSSCVVGLNGAAVSVQLDGPSATSQCDQWAATQVTNRGTWYVYRNGLAPGGAVICQVDWRDGNTYTVRDTGGTVYGSAICGNLLSPPVADAPSLAPEAGIASGIPDGPCTLGVEGHDVVIDVSNGGCRQFVDEIPAPFGGTYIVLDSTPEISVVCDVFAQGHYHAIVRDDLGLAYGTAICRQLRQLPGAAG